MESLPRNSAPERPYGAATHINVAGLKGSELERKMESARDNLHLLGECAAEHGIDLKKILICECEFMVPAIENGGELGTVEQEAKDRLDELQKVAGQDILVLSGYNFSAILRKLGTSSKEDAHRYLLGGQESFLFGSPRAVLAALQRSLRKPIFRFDDDCEPDKEAIGRACDIWDAMENCETADASKRMIAYCGQYGAADTAWRVANGWGDQDEYVNATPIRTLGAANAEALAFDVASRVSAELGLEGVTFDTLEDAVKHVTASESFEALAGDDDETQRLLEFVELVLRSEKVAGFLRSFERVGHDCHTQFINGALSVVNDSYWDEPEYSLMRQPVHFSDDENAIKTRLARGFECNVIRDSRVCLKQDRHPEPA